MKYKNFTITALILIVVYLFIHIFIWTKYTSNIFGRKDGKYVGGIGRVSYQIDALSPRKLEYTLPKQHLNKNNFKNKHVDAITIGDSFSHGVTGGKNPYYQDYLASLYNLNILNISRSNRGQLELFDTIITLYNNGWLKQHKPKYIIIESVERFVIPRFSTKFNFTQSSFTNIDDYVISPRQHNSYIPKLKFINTGNYKYLYYNFLYNKKPKVEVDVVKLNSKKNLFSTSTFKDKLLIHNEDIISLKNYNQKSVKLLNNNFNRLATMLNKLDIKLIFLVAPDKYDLYYEYIKNTPFQKNQFFDLIKPMKKKYIFINTKKILKELLDHNITDVYYSDDSHWSYKASEAISKSQVFKNLLIKQEYR